MGLVEHYYCPPTASAFPWRFEVQSFVTCTLMPTPLFLWILSKIKIKTISLLQWILTLSSQWLQQRAQIQGWRQSGRWLEVRILARWLKLFVIIHILVKVCTNSNWNRVWTTLQYQLSVQVSIVACFFIPTLNMNSVATEFSSKLTSDSNKLSAPPGAPIYTTGRITLKGSTNFGIAIIWTKHKFFRFNSWMLPKWL